jgi:hypothetical protein
MAMDDREKRRRMWPSRVTITRQLSNTIVPRECAIIICDSVGKLKALNVECDGAADAGATGLTD